MTLHPLFWAVGQTPATASQKMCLIAIASFADPSGRCHPSMTDIQKLAMLSDRATRRCVQELREQGFLTAESRTAKSGVNMPNSYRLNIPEDSSDAGGNSTKKGAPESGGKGKGDGVRETPYGVYMQGGMGSVCEGDGVHTTPYGVHMQGDGVRETPQYNIYTSRKKLLPGTATMTEPRTDPGTVLCKSSVRVVIQDSEREGGEPPHTPRGSDDYRGKNENREIVWEGASCRLNRRDYDNLRASCTTLATMDDTAFRRELNIADSLVMQQDKPPSSRFWALRALMLKRDSWAPKTSPKARPEKGSPEWRELADHLYATDPLFVGKIHECDWVKWERMKEARRKKAVA